MRTPTYLLYPISRTTEVCDTRSLWYETEDFYAACRVAQDKALRHQTDVAIVRNRVIHTIYRADGRIEQ
jgi:hypothetical protein